MYKKDIVPKHIIIADPAGNRYRFFCELSGIAIFTSNPIGAESPQTELQTVWEQNAKEHFNHCPRCGRWVSNIMYNADVCECVDCSPWESRPNYCKHCGQPIPFTNAFCVKCGKSIGKTNEQLEQLRLENMRHYGFGPDTMKNIKVCTQCGTPSPIDKPYCSECGHHLPFKTLYDIYKNRKITCSYCDTIVTSDTQYCPQCGEKINPFLISPSL